MALGRIGTAAATHGQTGANADDIASVIATLVDADGTAAHGHTRALRAPQAPRRDLADAVHALQAVHGTLPGLADEALTSVGARVGDGIAAVWLDAVAGAIGHERQALSRLVSAAGPLPSTPGQAATDSAFVAQRHAFQMLARSDRRGVAVGAVAALALDWLAVRRVLIRAADRYGVTLGPIALPDAADTATVLGMVADGNAAERAMLFGARALLEQHRALWTLLEARSGAREG